MAYNSNTMCNSILIKDVGRSYAWCIHHSLSTRILLAKDHALERKESFYVEIKVNTFVNFEVGHLKKTKSGGWEFPCTDVAVYFTYLPCIKTFVEQVMCLA